MIYAMSKKGDSNERFNLLFGFWPKPSTKRAPLLPKNHRKLCGVIVWFNLGRFYQAACRGLLLALLHDQAQFFGRRLPGG